jgi:uncharacterized coiled-coil DUF342 family protein
MYKYRKEVYQFFKWMDKLAYERGMKVVPELLKKVKKLENENYHYMARVNDFHIECDSYNARVKDLETKHDSYIAKVRQLGKEDDRHLKMLTYLENNKDMCRVREKFFMFGLLLSWLLVMLIGIIALSK